MPNPVIYCIMEHVADRLGIVMMEKGVLNHFFMIFYQQEIHDCNMLHNKMLQGWAEPLLKSEKFLHNA